MLLINESDQSDKELSLGDEDSVLNYSRLKLTLLLDTESDVYLYEVVFDNGLLYEDAAEQILELKQSVPSKTVDLSEIRKKADEYRS
ncbi:hypothetical protein [Neobacillus terrae]|uniref:hypothetical protein n=1 Tax=Neobacillus terrae TaxID=3034837 RepID=UPI00140CDEA3|nr:hypothetical protein [Neobacillus terrae]NHM32392.1 hypothetical protein [Neobacillus terrae]